MFRTERCEVCGGKIIVTETEVTLHGQTTTMMTTYFHRGSSYTDLETLKRECRRIRRQGRK